MPTFVKLWSWYHRNWKLYVRLQLPSKCLRCIRSLLSRSQFFSPVSTSLNLYLWPIMPLLNFDIGNEAFDKMESYGKQSHDVPPFWVYANDCCRWCCRSHHHSAHMHEISLYLEAIDMRTPQICTCGVSTRPCVCVFLVLLRLVADDNHIFRGECARTCYVIAFRSSYHPFVWI